ncbi:MAG: helix-turn-helix domain-containing protein [Nostoc sp.]|uniref:helix-turn-helix domain-containing protein n=1 Tax=Nostoc sp. TaxID=1180 RepID=UPI002FF76844
MLSNLVIFAVEKAKKWRISFHCKKILEDEDAEPTNTIITQLSDEAKLRMEVLQSLIEPCDRKTYGIKLKQAAQKLGKTVRTVQRLVKKYQEQGLSAI